MKPLYLIFLFFINLHVKSQTIESVPYLGQLKNYTGNAFTINVHVILTDSNSKKVVVYQERHKAAMNDKGYYELHLGQGTHSTGNFNQINWITGKRYLAQNIDSPRGFEKISAVRLPNITSSQAGKTNTKTGHSHVDALIHKAPFHWLGDLPKAPHSPISNEAYYNILEKKSFVYDGKNWKPLQPCSSTSCQTNGKKYCIR